MKRDPSGDRLNASQIVDLLLPRVRRPGDEDRAVDARIRKWLASAIRTGKLRGEGGIATGVRGKTFERNEVLKLAREHRNWRGLLSDLPARTSETMGSRLRISDAATIRVIPGSLQRCQQALREALDMNDNLLTALEQMRTRLAALEADAARWTAFKKRSGRRGRKDKS